jgi:glycosyltransferase involved in cell wall biosynthesis
MVLDEEFPPDVRVGKEIRTLQEAGHSVHLLCYTRSGQPAKETHQGIEIFRIPISSMNYKYKALALLFPNYFRFWKKHLQDQLNMFSYDALHFHDLNLASVSIEAARKKGIKVIGDYHENKPEIMKLYHHVRSFPGNILISVKKWERFQVQVSKLLDRLILVTPEARDYYSDHYGINPEKITVIENFPDLSELDKFKPDPEILNRYEDKKMILYFGDTGLRRGTGTLLKAAQKLKNNKDFAFAIIGVSREQKILEEQVQRDKLDNVELLGYVPLEKAVSYMQAAWTGICPFLRNIHHDTTYANKMFQYMAFGLPVIVSNCTAQENVVRKSECGLVFEADNVTELVKSIHKLENTDLYTRLSQNAKNAVKTTYNFDRTKTKLVQLYKNLSHEVA